MPRGPRGERRPTDPNRLGHKIIQIATGEEEDSVPPDQYRQGGLAGGAARSEKLSPEQRSEIARKAAKARWEKDG